MPKLSKFPIYLCLFSLILSLCGSVFSLPVSAEGIQNTLTAEEFMEYISDENNLQEIKSVIEKEINSLPMIQLFDNEISLGEPKKVACYHSKYNNYDDLFIGKSVICGAYMDNLLIGYLKFGKTDDSETIQCTDFVLFSKELMEHTEKDLALYDETTSYDNESGKHDIEIGGCAEIMAVTDSGFVQLVYQDAIPAICGYIKQNGSDESSEGKAFYEIATSEYHIPKNAEHTIAEIEINNNISEEKSWYIVNSRQNRSGKQYLMYSDGKYVLSDERLDDDSQLFTVSCDEDGNVAIRNKKSGRRIGAKDNFDLIVYYTKEIVGVNRICIRSNDALYALTKKDDGSICFARYYNDIHPDVSQAWFIESTDMYKKVIIYR